MNMNNNIINYTAAVKCRCILALRRFAFAGERVWNVRPPVCSFSEYYTLAVHSIKFQISVYVKSRPLYATVWSQY